MSALRGVLGVLRNRRRELAVRASTLAVDAESAFIAAHKELDAHEAEIKEVIAETKELADERQSGSNAGPPLDDNPLVGVHPGLASTVRKVG